MKHILVYGGTNHGESFYYKSCDAISFAGDKGGVPISFKERDGNFYESRDQRHYFERAHEDVTFDIHRATCPQCKKDFKEYL